MLDLATITYHERSTLAYAAGLDAGNLSMRKAKRTAWNEDDYNASVETYCRMMDADDECEASNVPRG